MTYLWSRGEDVSQDLTRLLGTLQAQGPARATNDTRDVRYGGDSNA